MAGIADYERKKIKRQIKMTWMAFHFLGIPILGPCIGRRLQEKIKGFRLYQATDESVSALIRNAERCAVGERVCSSCSAHSPVTESVFLDDLAIAMVCSRQARFVSADEAIATLAMYPDNPLIVSTIEGHEQEICRSYPKDCIYWNMKKRGFQV
jgi:hypothetical protein